MYFLFKCLGSISWSCLSTNKLLSTKNIKGGAMLTRKTLPVKIQCRVPSLKGQSCLTAEISKKCGFRESFFFKCQSEKCFSAVSETATSARATARSRASAYSSTLADALIQLQLQPKSPFRTRPQSKIHNTYMY